MKIYLTSSAACVQVRRGRAKPETAACVGPRSQVSIRPVPRFMRGESGAGCCTALTPPEEIFAEVRAGWLSMEMFKGGYLEQLILVASALAPGSLFYFDDALQERVLVEDGDTLTCSCSRAAADEGRCHRAWAAAGLKLAGWEVVLDGAPLTAERAKELLT